MPVRKRASTPGGRAASPGSTPYPKAKAAAPAASSAAPPAGGGWAPSADTALLLLVLVRVLGGALLPTMGDALHAVRHGAADVGA